MTLNEFCKRHDLTMAQATGKENIVGSLYLGSLTSIPDGFNPTVGGYLYLGGGFTAPTRPCPTFLEWQGGKYISVDGILSEVVAKRGNVWRVRIVGKPDESYIVTDAAGKFAHGKTIGEARESLIYKLSDRDTSRFVEMSMDDELSFADAIAAYRAITGACEQGVKHFIESNNINRRAYSVREIIDLTSGQYNSERFAKFFAPK